MLTFVVVAVAATSGSSMTRVGAFVQVHCIVIAVTLHSVRVISCTVGVTVHVPPLTVTFGVAM